MSTQQEQERPQEVAITIQDVNPIPQPPPSKARFRSMFYSIFSRNSQGQKQRHDSAENETHKRQSSIGVAATAEVNSGNSTPTPSSTTSRVSKLSCIKGSKRFAREYLAGKWDGFDAETEERYQDTVRASYGPVQKAMSVLVVVHFLFLLIPVYTSRNQRSEEQNRLLREDPFIPVILYAIILPITLIFPLVSFKKKRLPYWVENVIVCANGWVWGYGVIMSSVLCFIGARPAAICAPSSQSFNASTALYGTIGPLFMLMIYRLNRAMCLGAAAIFLAVLSWLLGGIFQTAWQALVYMLGFYIWATLISYWTERVDRENFRLRSELRQQIEATRKAQGGEIREAASKRRFVSYIFHEIRVPFNTAVLGFHSLEDEGVFSTLDTSRLSVVDAIKSSFTMMESVLNDVLDFQKMEEGKFELQSRPFDINTTVKSVAYAFASTANDKNISLEATVDDRISQCGGMHLLGDDIRYRQVLNNFVSNALKFTPRDGKVEIVTQLVGDSGMGSESQITLKQQSLTVRTLVKDTGVGIASEDLPKMFQPYIQINSWSTQGGKGTGLGLAICKHIIQMAGGTCGVESSPGQGSTFWFEVSWPVANTTCTSTTNGLPSVTSAAINHDALRRPKNRSQTVDNVDTIEVKPTKLPMTIIEVPDGNVAGKSASSARRNIPQPQPTSPQSTSPQPTSPQPVPQLSRLEASAPSLSATPNQPQPTQQRSLRVLIVDDDKITRMLMSRLLTQMGHRFEIAVDGQEAVERIVKCNSTRNGVRFAGNGPLPTPPPTETLSDTDAPFDVVLMDNQMPRLTGAEAVAVLRQQYKITVPVVGITGNALKEDQDQFVAAGADLVITKPLARGKLIGALGLIP